MNDLMVVQKLAEWQRLKTLVLDSVSSPITRPVYNMALDEFINWYRQAPRPGFPKGTVSAWGVSLEALGTRPAGHSSACAGLRRKLLYAHPTSARTAEPWSRPRLPRCL